MTKKSEIFEIINERGFHARPASLFVQNAGNYASNISVKNLTSGEIADGKSLMSLLILAAGKGTRLEVTADGPDAEEALKGLGTMIRGGFDED
ncbi:MAG: HPr family phosphocarrier protein [Lentisphaeria bacterium]|nr:HPr family phosphocarrier protein [Lentisphaeria bacterium]